MKKTIIQDAITINALKEVARKRIYNQSIKSWNLSVREANMFADKAIDSKQCYATLSITRLDTNTQTSFMSVILSGKEVEVNDIINPSNTKAKALIKQQNIFDAEYICLSRNETYKIIYTTNEIISLIRQFANDKNSIVGADTIIKKDLIDALISHIATFNFSDDNIKTIIDMLTTYQFIILYNGLSGDKELEEFIDKINLQKILLKKKYNVLARTKEEESELNDKLNKLALIDDEGSLHYIFTDKRKFYPYKKSDLKTLFEEYNTKKVHPIDEWLKSSSKMKFEGIRFYPIIEENNLLDQSKPYNLFKGLVHSSNQKVDITFFKVFVLNIICSKDTLMFNIVWSFFAQLIQDPTNKIGIALVLLSRQGSGKSIFVDTMGKIWKNYFMKSFNESDVSGEFNKSLYTTLLLYANEQDFTKDKKMTRLKALITQNTQTYKTEFKSSFQDSNYTRVIIDSNNHHVIHQSLYERRFLYPSISTEKVDDLEYYRTLSQKISQNGFIEALQYDLENFEYAPYIEQLYNPPKNEVMINQISLSMEIKNLKI